MKTATIGNGVNNIRANAFANCKVLEKISIGNGLKQIGHWAFYMCTGLKQFVIHATEPPSCIEEAFDGMDYNNCQLIVPEGSEEAYMTAEEWKRFNTINTVEGLEDESIVDVYNLQGVTVKKQVRMNDLQGTLPKGIYIVNGKKMAVR